MNASLYAELLLSCQKSAMAFDLIDEATSKDLPDGDSYKAWSNLKWKYEGRSLTEQLALQQEFYGSKLEDITKDPDEWISTLDKLRKRLNKDFKCNITDRDLLIQVINNMPDEYDTTMEMLMTSLATNEDDEKDGFLEQARLMINARFKKINAKRNKKITIENKETIFNMATMNGSRKKCYTCGKNGHIAADCFKDPKNAAKYEEWKKSNLDEITNPTH